MKKKNEKIMNKKGNGEFQWGRLFTLLLGLVVILALIYVVMTYWAPGVLENIFPFLGRNSTLNPFDDPSINMCPEDFTQIGTISNKGKYAYVSFDSGESYVYFQDGKIYVDIPGDTNIPVLSNGVKDKYLGNIAYIDDKKSVSLDGDAREYSITGRGLLSSINYNQYVPSQETMDLFSRSYIYGNFLCVVNSFFVQKQKNEACKLTCAIINGICSRSSIPEKISNGGMDCSDEELCYIDETLSKLKSENFYFYKQSYLATIFEKFEQTAPSKQEKIMDLDSFSVPMDRQMQLLIWINSKTPYCWAFDNDKTYNLGQEYYTGPYNDPRYPKNNDKIIYHNVVSGRWTQSKQKIIQIVVWNEATKEKIIKRWKINAEISDVEDGKILFAADDFKTALENADDGAVFYITGIRKDWGKGVYTDNYKIVREGERASVYAYFPTVKDGTRTYRWVILSCSTGFSLYKSVPIEELETKFQDTLANCFTKSFLAD